MSTIYTFNNKVLKNRYNDKWLTKKEGWICPAGTIRAKFASEFDVANNQITLGPGQGSEVKVCVDAAQNIWDISYPTNQTWYGLNGTSALSILEIIGLNLDGISVGAPLAAWTCRK